MSDAPGSNPTAPHQTPSGWRHFARRALPAYWIFLFCATHFPRPQLPGRVPSEDKLAHIAAFATLAALFYAAALTSSRPLSRLFPLFTFLILTTYAALDEYLQAFVNRSPSVGDFLADATGVLATILVIELIRRGRRNPSTI